MCLMGGNRGGRERLRQTQRDANHMGAPVQNPGRVVCKPCRDRLGEYVETGG